MAEFEEIVCNINDTLVHFVNIHDPEETLNTAAIKTVCFYLNEINLTLQEIKGKMPG